MNGERHSMESFPIGPRNELKRLPERGRYDRSTVYGILDEGLMAHVGFAAEGQPFVLPMAYVRIDDAIYLHGSPANQMLRRLAKGAPACATVTLLDGLVLARSAFHHSMNFRSAVIFGTARAVEDLEDRRHILERLVESIIPGRAADARPPTRRELQFTEVLALPIEEASAKVRSGPPNDDAEDLGHPAWAGVIPLALESRPPIADPSHPPLREAPAYAKGYRRGPPRPPE